MNPLTRLIGNYGDSDEESDNESGPQRTLIRSRETSVLGMQTHDFTAQSASIHPAPIAHCPWSACYDESSGFTYYWNQQTNAVTWEAPPEYLLALKLAQQQLHSQGSTEVSVEEWQLYQQALAEKQQSKVISKGALIKPAKNNEKPVNIKNKNDKKRKFSDVEDEKIELITSYYNSDSESNEEPDILVKSSPCQPPLPKPPKTANKKIKPKPTVVQYGPTLPSNQNYSIPIGPELPQEKNYEKPKSPENKVVSAKAKQELKKTKSSDTEDSNDESLLLTKLKDKAKLLEKLGGELPSGLQKIIEEETIALNKSPKLKDIKSTEDNIDELLNEIETKELPKVKTTKKIDMFDEADAKYNDSLKGSPESRDVTPPIEQKPLFPSIKNISVEQPQNPCSIVNNEEVNTTESEEKIDISSSLVEKKGANLYLMGNSEPIENVSRKKLRLSNSVLPERKKNETPSYTTKYSEHIEGFSNERTGLGFTKDEDTEGSVKNTISYGNGLTFTKGETLNEEKKDEDLDNLTDLVEAKLKYLNQLQPCLITPVQEMLIQMQTLVSAFRSGALGATYWRRWAEAASLSLRRHEASAAPPGWTCAFQRYITCTSYPPRPRPRPHYRLTQDVIRQVFLALSLLSNYIFVHINIKNFWILNDKNYGEFLTLTLSLKGLIKSSNLLSKCLNNS